MKEIIDIFMREIGQEVESIQYFTGGTNDNYLINHKYIFRRKKGKVDRFYDGNLEKEIEEKIDGLEITIPCLYFDPVKGIKITPYFENGSSLSKLNINKKLAVNAAEKLRDLHERRIKVSKDFSIFNRIRYYREEARIDKYEYHDTILRNIQKYYQNEELFLCHNNMKANNVMKSGSSYFLMDFEDGGNNLIYFDVFSLYLSPEISKKEKDIFLTTYFKGKLPKNITQIRDDFCSFIDLYNFYWNVMMYKKTLDVNYSHDAENCFQRMESFFNK